MLKPRVPTSITTLQIFRACAQACFLSLFLYHLLHPQNTIAYAMVHRMSLKGSSQQHSLYPFSTVCQFMRWSYFARWSCAAHFWPDGIQIRMLGICHDVPSWTNFVNSPNNLIPEQTKNNNINDESSMHPPLLMQKHPIHQHHKPTWSCSPVLEPRKMH